MRYVIYARKSTESDDRQTISIQSQIIEMQEIARRDDCEIVKIFQESKSAKKPGRPVFAEMIDFIEEGKAEGILCWKIDRLSRNPMDEGTIKWMLQNETIKQIRTFDREYNPEDNVVMASIEFSMATQYIRDLSKNVKRGLAEKVRRGEYPGAPPFGYRSDPKTKRLVVVEKEAKFIRKAFELYVSKLHSTITVAEELQKQGFRSREGGRIVFKSIIHRILTNPIYCGMFGWKGQIHVGTHEPIISKKLFDQAQSVMERGKSTHRTDAWKMNYRGFLVCGECGLRVTAEQQKGHVYYRCTKTFGAHKCSQPYVREEKLVELLGEELERYRIDDDVISLVVDASKESYARMGMDTKEKEAELLARLEGNKRRRDSLVEKFIDNAFPKEIYDKEYSKLSNEEADIREEIRNLKAEDGRVIEQIETIANFIKAAHDIFNKGDEDIKREVAFLLSSNVGLKDRKIAHFNINEPFSWLITDLSSLTTKNGLIEPSINASIKGKTATFATAVPTLLGR